MKKYLHPKFLPILVPTAGLLACVLRLWTMANSNGLGPDSEGLYAPHPVAWALLWIVTIGTVAAIVLLSARLKNPGRYVDNFPASIPGAVGNVLAALGIMLYSLRLLTTGSELLYTATGILGIASAIGLMIAAFNRFRGQKCSFLLHAIPCLFFALRIFERCKAWSNIPQVSVFLFPFLASVCAMLASYQLSCFDVNLGKRKKSLFWSLCGVYCAMISVIGSDDPLFYLCIGAWLLTNLCSVRPLKARKPQQEQPAAEAAPEAAPSSPVTEPAAEEDMSYDKLLDWLDKE